MNFLESIGKTATDAARLVAEKSVYAANVTKLKLAISNEYNNIRKANVELGKRYYDDYKSSVAHDEVNYIGFCVKIDAARDRIAAMEKELKRLQAEQNGTAELDAAPEKEPDFFVEEKPQEADSGDFEVVVVESDQPPVDNLFIDESEEGEN